MFNRNFWDEYMLRYDDAVATLHPYRELLARCIAWGLQGDQGCVMDLGCGTGNLLRRVADRLAGRSRLIGLERCATAREVAARKFSLDERCEILPADLEQPGWSAGMPEVELCFMNNVLYDLEDPAVVLDELRGLLRPGGRLILSNPHAPRPAALLEAHMRWREGAGRAAREQDDRYAAAREWMLAANLEIARHAVDRRLHFLDLSAMTELLRRAGFEVCRAATNAYAGVNLIVEAQRVG